MRPRLARRSLKPQLNQIRTWVRQGRTDAWIAHQLDVSVKDITVFKREHDLAPPEAADGDGSNSYEEGELDLRAEDDALVAAELDAEQDTDADDDPDEEPESRPAARSGRDDESGADADSDSDEGDDDQPRRRRRGRRGGRGRGRTAKREPLEGTFDHGEEGYGLWLDPSVQDDPVYAEHWAGHRPVTVTVEADRIVIIRSGEGSADD